MLKKIKTDLGFISGRDAIHLDKVQHFIESLELIFEGVIDSDSCSIKQKSDWINYSLTFINVKSYSCTQIDDSIIEKDTESSFDCKTVKDGEYIDYVLSTYDYIYEIKAQKGHFVFTEELNDD